VFADLIALIERTRVAALIATHNMELARRMHRVLRLQDGTLREVAPSAAG
jgi:lipoprotein-releasing system ATP-binding protein